MTEALRGTWAVVTGASSGLGVDFARELAVRGVHLVLCARREDRMRALARELSEKHGIEVDVVALDLGTASGAEALYQRVKALGREITVLVNNAGFGLYGYELELSWDREREMLELDMLTLVQLTRSFAADMVHRGRGYVLNVASIAGTQPSPTFAAYAAAKSFVISYSHALREELRGTGVSCTVLAPGATATEFFDVSGAEETLYIRLVKMQSADVVRAGVRGLLKRRAMVIPGLLNRLSVWAMGLLPWPWVARIVHLVMKSRNASLPRSATPEGTPKQR